MKYKLFLTLVAFALLLVLNLGIAQTEPDVLWTFGDIHSSFSSHPVVHPNGNVLIGDKTNEDVVELNGLTGEIVRRIPIAIQDHSPEKRIEISSDGSKMLIGHYLVDYQSGNIIKPLPEFWRICFLHPSNDIVIYIKPSSFQPNDSNLVIYNITNETSTIINTTDFPTALEVSKDGKYLALGCRDRNLVEKTYFYLFNAQTMKKIKDLEITESEGRVIEYIQFSENAKYVGYGQNLGGKPKATLFQCEEPYLKWEVNKQDIPPYGMHCIGFIKDDYAFMSQYFNEKSVGIIWDINSEKEIYRTELYESSLPVYNKVNNTILVGSTLNYNLVSLDLNNLLDGVSVEEKKNIVPKFTTEYNNGLLIIDNYTSITGNVNIEIFDIKGKLVHKIDLVPNNPEIQVPLILTNGMYLIKISDGNQRYNGKFLVVD